MLVWGDEKGLIVLHCESACACGSLMASAAAMRNECVACHVAGV
jgi:hypothetical protein